MFQIEKTAFEDRVLTTFCGLGPEAFDRIVDWNESIPEFERTISRNPITHMSATFTIRLKVALVEETAARLGMTAKDFMEKYRLDSNTRGYIYEKEVESRLNVYQECIQRDIDYRGCRTEEAKRKKYEKIRAELRDEVAQRKAQIERGVYAKANLAIAHAVEYLNAKVVERHLEYLEKGGWASYVDDRSLTLTQLKSQLASLEEVHKSLMDEIYSAEDALQKARCKVMAEQLNGDAGNALPGEVREAMLEAVNQGKAFKKESALRLFA